MDIKYNRPKTTDTAVCMCFFSPAGFKTPKNNFLCIQSMLQRANIPIYTAECVIGNEKPLLKNPTIQVKSNSYLFYKEQLYNLLVPKIPECYTKLIFIDGDIVFNKKDWVDQISNALDTYDVVQPFETAIWNGPYHGSTLRTTNSVFFGIKNMIDSATLINYHSGFSFAMTRNFFNSIGGFFDKCVIGGGDSSFCRLFINLEIQYTYSKSIQSEYNKWFEKAINVPKNFTYLPITVNHLYHGTIENRQYLARHKLLDGIESWDHAIYTNEDGMYELKYNNMNQIMKDYFSSRKEDDVPPFNFNLVKRI